MSGTFSNLLVHVVFSTKERERWITPLIAKRLHPYMGGIVRAHGAAAIAIGGVEDHVHLLVRMKPDQALADLMRMVKARSSRWIHERFPALREFAWQEGYAAFSVSKSNEAAVKRYIENQAEHHAQRGFKDELIAMLERSGVEYDERYVFS
jgi:REP element-mobilizing transposase RayT